MHRRHTVVGLALGAACFRGRSLWDHRNEWIGRVMHNAAYFSLLDHGIGCVMHNAAYFSLWDHGIGRAMHNDKVGPHDTVWIQ